MTASFHVDWSDPGYSGPISSSDDMEAVLSKAGKRLSTLLTGEIIGAFEDLSASLLQRGNPLCQLIPERDCLFWRESAVATHSP